MSFTNLVDFDALFGHRRDPIGYGNALQEFDSRLPEILILDTKMIYSSLQRIMEMTRCTGTDHTREYVPLLIYSPSLEEGGELPLRNTFADVGATIADNFNVPLPEFGESFLSTLTEKV